MKDNFLGLIIMITGGAGWLTSVISDASNNRFGWVLVDVLAFPLGVIRGMAMWFGWY